MNNTVDALKIHVYDKQLNRIFEFSTYLNLLIEDAYNSYKPFYFQIIITDDAKEKLKEDYYVRFGERVEMYVIKSLEYKGDTLMVAGYGCARLLEDRNFTGTLENVNVEQALYNAIDIMTPYAPIVRDHTKGLTDMFNRQVSDKSINELSKIMCSEVDMGYRITKKDKTLLYEVYKPVETENIKFSSKFGNLKDRLYTSSVNLLKNVAYVMGQGVSDERITVLVGEVAKTGNERKEMIIDARSERQEKDETLDVYKERLNQLGIEKLAEQIFIENIEFTIGSEDYGKRFSLGDIVTVIVDDLGIKVKARVVGAITKVQNNVTTVDIKVGNQIITRRK